jgi:chemotaxis response regulator CheB
VIVVSAAGSAEENASAVRALELGAVEFVRKPSGPVSIDLLVVRDELLRALDAASAVRFGKRAAPVTSHKVRTPARPQPRRNATRVVVIAASTGGPRAVAEVVSGLSGDLDAAVLIVQHMPSEFIPTLAARLSQLTALPVTVAADGEPLLSGRVYLAPGSGQMRLRRGHILRHDRHRLWRTAFRLEALCRPSLPDSGEDFWEKGCWCRSVRDGSGWSGRSSIGSGCRRLGNRSGSRYVHHLWYACSCPGNGRCRRRRPIQ